MIKIDKKIFSWAMYDWANSAYATTVMAAFFPVFFKDYWCGSGVTNSVSNTRLGLANSLSCFLVVLIAPVLGAIADRSGGKKIFLAVFTLLGVISTVMFASVDAGNWQSAGVLFLLASIGFSGGLTFYDSLLLNVANEDRLDLVSGLGYAFGYIGGAILLSFNVLMLFKKDWFGIVSDSQAIKYSFISVGLWWLIFSIPLFIYVPDRKIASKSVKVAISEGLSQLINTFKKLRHHKTVFTFLIAYWFYIDGVDTIFRMAGAYGRSIGLDRSDLILAILITNFIGFPAAILYGYIGQKIGCRKGIFFAIFVYICITFFAAFMRQAWEFYALAIAVGLVQGGIQALSRSYFTRLVPKGQQGEFFGIYNMLGKFAAFLGPLLVVYGERVSLYMGAEQENASRYGIFSVILLFVIGAIIFYFVKPETASVSE